MKEKYIDYITQRGYEYRIVYHRIGFCLWEWDVLQRVEDDKGDYCGLTFGEERTLFPKSRMASILRGYSENKDDYNEQHNVNLDAFRHIRG